MFYKNYFSKIYTPNYKSAFIVKNVRFTFTTQNSMLLLSGRITARHLHL